MFTSYIHSEGTVYKINKISFFFNFILILDIHIHREDLERFRKPPLQLTKYVHIDPITDFCIYVIPEAFFQARAFKLVQLKH